jgi:putative transposase
MVYNPAIHHRRSIRLKGYDYSQNGLYFITICTHRRQHLFGQITKGIMRVNSMGAIVHDEWRNTARIRSDIRLHEFIAMPNHIHGIVEIVGDDVDEGRGMHASRVGNVVRGYKSSITRRINELRDISGGPIWQRNYHESIIRNEMSYLKVSTYIRNNPRKWSEDIFHY